MILCFRVWRKTSSKKPKTWSLSKYFNWLLEMGLINTTSTFDLRLVWKCDSRVSWSCSSCTCWSFPPCCFKSASCYCSGLMVPVPGSSGCIVTACLLECLAVGVSALVLKMRHMEHICRFFLCHLTEMNCLLPLGIEQSRFTGACHWISVLESPWPAFHPSVAILLAPTFPKHSLPPFLARLSLVRHS